MSTQGVLIQQNVSLREKTYWKIGGPAEFFCQPKNLDELRKAYQWALDNKKAFTVLGGGTNVLVSDLGIEGLVIAMKDLSGISTEEKEGRLHLHCQAGTAKSELVKIFLSRKMTPAIFLCGLPGDVGGGIVMNAGVSEDRKPKEFYEMVDAVHVLRPNGQLEMITADNIKWSYRESEGWQPGIIYAADLSWPIDIQEDVPTLVRQSTKNRLDKQPLNYPSCGSVFRNPPGQKAGWLIEQVQLKGHRLGDAQISEKHANFIINLGQARAEDVKALIDLAKERVFSKFHVKLETEVKMLGRK